MKQEHEIVSKVLAAQGDPLAADDLIESYLPFIKSETYKATGKLPTTDAEDELSIAMFAFYEAIESYSKQRGAFLPYASLLIRRKIIDYYRKEKRHTGSISGDAPAFSQDDEATVMDLVADPKDNINEGIQKNATRDEIAELTAQLTQYGLSLTDIADNCPKQERTLKACLAAVQYAKEHPELITELVKTGRLPLAALSDGSGTPRKTLERHRKYIMALLLIYSNGYEIIRGHLKQLSGLGGKLSG